MNTYKIIATVSVCEQIGESEFVQRRFSCEFPVLCNMREILSWAEEVTGREQRINDIQFSECYEAKK